MGRGSGDGKELNAEYPVSSKDEAAADPLIDESG